MSHSKAQSLSSSSTLPVMSPFFKPRNEGKLCSQKTSCPTSRTQLSCQGVTHAGGLIIVGKRALFLGAPKQWPERLLSASFLSKTIYLISSSLQGGQPTGQQSGLENQQGDLNTCPSGFSFLSVGSPSSISSLEAVLEVERKNMESPPTHPYEVILTSLHSVRS